MGCDIHAFIEIKKETGEWEYCGEVNICRSYTTFFAMAGVRGHDGDGIIYEPRGLPNDCTKYLREEYDDSYYHTASWLDIFELSDVMSKTKITNILPAIRMCYNYWVRKKGIAVRLVFWFDN